MKKRLFTLIAAASMLPAFAAPVTAEEYRDVAADAWYYDCVDYVTDNGLIDSIDAARFAPEEKMTRGVLVTAIGRCEGIDINNVGESRFKDIPESDIAAPYAAWAGNNGIVEGYDASTFGPNDLLTREQMAQVLYNYYKYLKENTQVSRALTFVDANDISDWARRAVAFCSETGLMEGDEKNFFLPKANLTRAQTAMILYSHGKAHEKTEYIPETEGRVTEVDNHGHVTTDITIREFTAVGFMTGDVIEVTVPEAQVVAPYCTTYTDVDNDKLLILSTDSEHITVAINMGSFGGTYGVKVGDKISFKMYEKDGYASELELRSSVIYTNDREDYSSDEVFANFREITAGDIKAKTLYRSSTPIYSQLGRNQYADVLCANAKIETVINLSEKTEEEMKSRDGYEGSYYSTLDVKLCPIGLEMDSELFAANMPRALRAIGEGRTPILIQCRYGKDQTGLVAMMVEALCGASYDEIVDDYMLSYENFYHIEKGSDQWIHIAEGAIIPSLSKMTGINDREQLKAADLKEAASTYMKHLGLTDNEIAAIVKKLCN